MTEKSSTSIPWAGVVVVLAFVSSTYLKQQPFEVLRPADTEHSKPPAGVTVEVDARLWEDPFAAWRRYDAERAARCTPTSQAGAGKQDWECSPAQIDEKREARGLRDALRATGNASKLEETLVIAALVPGQPFLGAEEYRRRTRYALLTGLQAMGYAPHNSDRIKVSQLLLRTVDSKFGSATNEKRAGNRSLIVPFELLSLQVPPDAAQDIEKIEKQKDTKLRYRSIAVVWIDEAMLPGPFRLDSLASVLAQMLTGADHRDTEAPQLAVIGPSSSDELRDALDDLDSADKRLNQSTATSGAASGASAPSPCKAISTATSGAASGASAPSPSEAILSAESGGESAMFYNDVCRGYRHLAQATLLNAASTAPESTFKVLQGKTLEDFVKERLDKFFPKEAKERSEFKRTIATDDKVLDYLVAELRRRMPPPTNRRVVLVAEHDSVYAMALVNALIKRIQDRAGEAKLSVEVVYFFRGIDGMTTRQGGNKASDGKPVSDATQKPATTIEWPESRDQLDYLRRLATSLQDSEAVKGKDPIGAIGIIASDVHDKLLVLQALHSSFSDKVFFTTDMDARFLHPRTNGFTRNLVVASSLPLEFRALPPSQEVQDRTLQAGMPPMRDVYQSAIYLAARRATCRSDPCKKSENAFLEKVLNDPSVYEIGRHREIPLMGFDYTARLGTGGSSSALVGAMLGVLLAGALLIWPSTPAVRSARARWLSRAELQRNAAVQPTASAAWLAALHAVWLAFAVGSLIEFAWPGTAGAFQLLLVAGLGGLFVGVALHPWPAVRAGAPAPARPWLRHLRGHSGLRIVALGLLVFCVIAAIAWPRFAVGPCPECEPVAWLEGVSAWPSQLIHLAALAVVAWALDDFWSNTTCSTAADAAWLGLPDSVQRTQRHAAVPHGPLLWLALNTLAVWRRAGSQPVRFLPLWFAYLWRGRKVARAVRVGLAYAVTLLMAALLFRIVSSGYVPEVPVRGAAHRDLITWTLYAVLLALPLLVVTVADATMLECRFIERLCRGRAAFPSATIAHFAQTLGGDFAAGLAERRAADPLARRVPTHPPAPAELDGPHTLLDDWITVGLVARRTRIVGPLVIGPFVVLALMVVARSRLFDNWALTLPVALVAAAYLLWLVALAALLKLCAERLRRKALDRMNADLLWLAGSGQPALAEAFKRLVGAVETNTTGAFASFFDQPLFKALLVPLGGAGGAQLFDRLLGL